MMKRSPLLCLVVALTSGVGLAAPQKTPPKVSEADMWLERQSRLVTRLDIQTYNWEGSLDLYPVDVNNPQGLTTSDRKTIERLFKMLHCYGRLSRPSDKTSVDGNGSWIELVLTREDHSADYLQFYRIGHRYRLLRYNSGRETVGVATVSDDSAARFLGYLRHLKAGARKRGAKMKFYDLEPGN